MSGLMQFYKEIDQLEAEKKALIGALVRYKKREKLIEKLLNNAQTRNDQLETILEDYLEHTECGLLCCGCQSDKTGCIACGIGELEARTKQLLGKGVNQYEN